MKSETKTKALIAAFVLSFVVTLLLAS